jgi:hypothetical protein
MSALEVVREVLAERRRHVAEEGWTPEHDDTHRHGELARAAASYANMGSLDDRTRPLISWNHTPPPTWPWSPQWWKPKSQRRDLIRAASLIVAEIERLDRAERSKPYRRGVKTMTDEPDIKARIADYRGRVKIFRNVAHAWAAMNPFSFAGICSAVAFVLGAMVF